jgi:hypothetical protein
MILDQSLALELFTQGITRRVDLFVRGWTSARWSARTSGSWSDILRMIQRRVQDYSHHACMQESAGSGSRSTGFAAVEG